jgi:hypothetical protein
MFLGVQTLVWPTIQTKVWTPSLNCITTNSLILLILIQTIKGFDVLQEPHLNKELTYANATPSFIGIVFHLV